MKIQSHNCLGILCSLFLWIGCGGSASDSGSGTRALTGSVAPSEVAALKTQTDRECLADTVIATDTAGETTVTSVDSACDFTLELAIGSSYVISFTEDGSFLATLIFDSGIVGFTSSDLTMTAGVGAIDLGPISISGNLAVPENEPEAETDEDGDGLDDLEDEDDDDDGVEDELDGEDCDLDGIEEGDEEDEECGEETTARVLEVKPRNDPHTDEGEDRIDLDKDVKARLSCEVDQSTVTEETFRVDSPSDVISCTYKFSGSGRSGNRIECEHDDQDFLPDTVYTATVDGVKCLDGRDVTPRSWSWLTEEDDDDKGDVEDDLDDEDEAEDDDEDEDEEEEDDDED